MQCTSPVTLVSHGKRQEVPCGQCMSCRLCRAREWSTRCLHEAAYWSASAFVTLTYRDECLPEHGSLQVDELQRFHKRLRKALGRPIRYYACGEYGERTGRPHYHGVYFGVSPCSCSALPNEACLCVDRMAFVRAWGRGGIPRFGTVTSQSARYVADYVGKKVTGRLALDAYGVRQAPFAVMSKGIGRRYALDHQYQLAEQMSVTVNGVSVGLPRYYMHVLELEADPDVVSEVPSKRRYSWSGNQPVELVDVEDRRKQRRKDVAARVALFSRDETAGSSETAP